jgi:nitroreductase
MKERSMSESKRKADYPILPLLLNRASSRALSGESVSELELNILFEAARWGASSFNEQPWRYIYAQQGDEQWQKFFDLLVPANQVWAKAAWVLMVVVSDKNFSFNGEFSPTHSYDTGAAGQNMALQGFSMGLIVHAIGGFDYARARDLLELPNQYAVEAMIAVGRPGSVSALPEKLQAREVLTTRKPVSDIVFRQYFKQG